MADVREGRMARRWKGGQVEKGDENEWEERWDEYGECGCRSTRGLHRRPPYVIDALIVRREGDGT
jgi:hypothetical protein